MKFYFKNNLNYVICLERGKDYCSVNYIMEQIGGGNTDQLDFQIINKDEGVYHTKLSHISISYSNNFKFPSFFYLQMKMI